MPVAVVDPKVCVLAADVGSLSGLTADPAPVDWSFYKNAIRTNVYVDQIKASVCLFGRLS